jgi:hypothetical protein
MWPRTLASLRQRMAARRDRVVRRPWPLDETVAAFAHRRPGGLPPQRGTLTRLRLPIVGANRAIERAVERGEHPPLGEAEGGRLPITRTRQRGADFGENPTRSRRHDHDLVSKDDRLINVMGDEEQRRFKIRPQTEQMILEIHAGEGVERGKRFVEKQHIGSRHQRPGQRDALGLPAGELAGPGAGLFREPNPCERRVHARLPIGGGPVTNPKGHIAGHREPRQLSRLLKHDADPLMRSPNQNTVETDGARGRPIQPADKPQQS